MISFHLLRQVSQIYVFRCLVERLKYRLPYWTDVFQCKYDLGRPLIKPKSISRTILSPNLHLPEEIADLANHRHLVNPPSWSKSVDPELRNWLQRYLMGLQGGTPHGKALWMAQHEAYAVNA